MAAVAQEVAVDDGSDRGEVVHRRVGEIVRANGGVIGDIAPHRLVESWTGTFRRNESIIRTLVAIIVLCAITSTPTFGQSAASTQENPDLPKVVLVGDSIRLSYAPIVTKQLEGKAVVVSPKANGGDSSNVLKNLEQWVIRNKPTVVHFNYGIHDTKKFKSTGKFQVSPDEYDANLRKIVERIRKETGAVVLFATTTPILDDRAAAARQDRDYELLGASVEQYNAIAKKVMAELKVPVNDLHTALSEPGSPRTIETLIGNDGVHLTKPAKGLLGKQVAAFVSKHLTQSPK